MLSPHPRQTSGRERRAARAAMAHVRPVARASVAVLTVSVCVTFVLTVLFTYTTCVLQSQCPPLPQLPTISDTWTHPPGNFVSREAVSVLALFLMLLQCVLWLPEQPAFPHLARWCMRVGLFSAFCLSWVGAICDDGKVTLTLSLTLALALSLALTLAHPNPDPSPSPSPNPNPNPNPNLVRLVGTSALCPCCDWAAHPRVGRKLCHCNALFPRWW